MRRILTMALAISFAFSLFSVLPAMAKDTNLLSSYEMDNLLGPIALYPDPLLAQLLPAATYPDQLLEAYQLIQLRDGDNLIDEQNWDVSVMAISHYPSVVKKMVYDPDWSDAVGQAYIYQPEDVMRSIQRLRSKARLLGYLSSNNEQEVIYERGEIRIIPAQARYIYVPVYDSNIVYITRRPQTNTIGFFISFGSGFSIGSWLNRDCDWQQNRVYYHGLARK